VALTLSHYRFGVDELAESTHGWHAAEDTDPAEGVIAVDTTFLLRFTVQANAAAGLTNVDNNFEFRLNGGTWTQITTSSSVVKAVAATALTNGGNCTKRLSGTGTFETTGAGQTEDGISGGTANDIVASGNSETECGLQIVGADVAGGDLIEFRLTRDAQVLLDTYSVVPSITRSPRVCGAVLAGGDHCAELGSEDRDTALVARVGGVLGQRLEPLLADGDCRRERCAGQRRGDGRRDLDGHRARDRRAPEHPAELGLDIDAGGRCPARALERLRERCEERHVADCHRRAQRGPFERCSEVELDVDGGRGCHGRPRERRSDIRLDIDRDGRGEARAAERCSDGRSHVDSCSGRGRSAFERHHRSRRHVDGRRAARARAAECLRDAGGDLDRCGRARAAPLERLGKRRVRAGRFDRRRRRERCAVEGRAHRSDDIDRSGSRERRAAERGRDRRDDVDGRRGTHRRAYPTRSTGSRCSPPARRSTS
jgi:hypothetical protein